MPTITEIPDPPAPTPAPALAPSSGSGGAGGEEGAGGDATKDKNEKWRFLEPQPVREDQVDNAVKFLSHPKVRGSPVVYRRSFLERKGLSREEIDEAFRRVPDPPSEAATTVPAAGNASVPQQRAPVQVAQKTRSWTQMLLALGVLTAAGAGAGVVTKKYFIPKLREWLLEVVSGKSKPEQPSKPSLAEEATSAAAAAATAAATAASQMAGAMQEISKYRSEDRQRLENLVKAIDAQTQEIKMTLAGMKDAVQNAEVTKYQRAVTNNFQVNAGQNKGIRASETRASTVMKPTNYGSETGASAAYVGNGQDSSFPKDPISPSSSNGSIHAPHSQSYLDVVAMLERGEKPPGIKEVNDKPPNPTQPPSNPRLQPRPKPWEKHTDETHPTSSVIGVDPQQVTRYDDDWRNDGSSGPQEGPSLVPWWRKKMDTGDVYNTNSVKITEIDPAAEVDIGTVPDRQSNSTSSSGQNGGGRTGWVPPAVPQTVYPGAEEAIRRVRPTSAGGNSTRNLASSSGSASASEIPTHGNDALASKTILGGPVPEDAQINEARAEVPDEQESDYLERSLVDPNRSFKDVVEEGD